MSILVWEGPSRLDGSPIRLLLTFGSTNPKTGDMVQSWIVRADMSPVEAVKRKLDGAICGECPRRHGRGCYVTVWRAPLQAWRSVKETWTLEKAAARLRGRRLRIGAYGDPAAVPLSVWATLTRHTAGHSGYTHSPDRAPGLKALCMASVENELEATRLQAQGWRTFRVRSTDDYSTLPGEITCPASKEAGKVTACEYCLKCNGASGRSKQNIAISEHGLVRRRLEVVQ